MALGDKVNERKLKRCETTYQNWRSPRTHSCTAMILKHALCLTLLNSSGVNRVGCVGGDAALVAGVARHGDVAVQAPPIAPRVFDHVPGSHMKREEVSEGEGRAACTTEGWRENSS